MVWTLWQNRNSFVRPEHTLLPGAQGNGPADPNEEPAEYNRTRRLGRQNA
jgi:hypothetical protein